MFSEIQNVTRLNKEEILALKIADEQIGFLETTEECLAEAEEDPRVVPVGLYKENRAVGFAMYGQFQQEDGTPRVWLDRYFIDERYQQMGLGKYYLQLLIHYLAEFYHTEQIYLSVYEDNTVAIRLYEQFGFRFNGENDEKGEKIMVKEVEGK